MPRGRGRDGRNAAGAAGREHLAADGQHEEVQTVDVEVDAVQECVEVVLAHPLREGLDVDLRVDVARHAGQHIELALAHRAHEGAGLAVQVVDIKLVEVGQVEVRHAQARQRVHVLAAHAAKPGNGDAPATQLRLLSRCGPTDVA